MKIVLSAHFDIAKPVPFITLEDKKLKGLIDNFAGVLVAWEAHKKTGVPLYLTNFEESGLPAGRQGFEGAREVALKLKDAARYPFSSNATRSELSAGPAGGFPPRTPTRGPLLGGPPAPVTRKRLTLGGNAEKAIPSKASRFEPLVIVVDTTRDAGRFPAYIGNVYNFDVTPLQKKFAKDIFFMPGLFEETEDETWVYGHEKGLPTFYFGIPISHHKDYHDTDNAITLKQIQRSGKVLISLIKNIEK